MNPTDPLVSIVIPTLKEAEYLERTLKNFADFSLPHEIIITDGGSTDGTLEIARRYTDKITLWDKPRRQTFGEAKNAGAALARGKFLVFIDADVHIEDGDAVFGDLIAAFERSPQLVALTVPLLPYKGNPFADQLFQRLHNLWYTISNNVFGYANSPGEFQMIRADAFRKVGGYNERIPGGEDCDIFNRLGKVGKTRSFTRRFVRHSCRRQHKLGWLIWLWVCSRQGFYILLLNRSSYKEWKVIR